ncbi:SusC/RagA family TonB-linked outer membrane protein [Chitinophaga agrisoli]|nr:SusC/RagA family TonB-linked outer membrane protein [Chitinophaga agrisoli]
MKLIMVLMLVGALHVSATGFGQRVTMKVKNAPLTQVCKLLTAQTGQEFLLSPAVAEHAAPVTIDVKNRLVEELLGQLLKDRGLRYEIRNNIIIITKAPVTATLVTPPNVADTGSLRPHVLIRGRVIDINGTLLPGATVMIKGTRRGAQTDANGYFEISSDQEDNTMVITYTGYNVMTAKANPRVAMTIVLSPATNDLDQVQVIGYGKTTKRFNTGDVTTIKGEDIRKNPVSNVLVALQGRVPGMVITQDAGLPGASIRVNIRGINSFAGNDPLYIIDGVPYPSRQLNPTMLNQALSGGNFLSYFNPADIESVDVLKDADATAIYGSRGANGVILITTRKGKPGNARIDVNVYSGFSKPSTAPRMLNLEQYMQMRHEAKANDKMPILPNDYDLNGTWDTTRYTDWSKQLLDRKAHTSDAQISIAGGANSTTYRISSGYHRETSVQPGGGADQRANLHFNTNTETANRKVGVQLSGDYVYSFNNIHATDLAAYLFNNPPVSPDPFNADGTLNWANGQWSNPYQDLQKRYKKRANNLIGNAVISYRPLKGLELKTSLGYNTSTINEFLGTPLSFFSPLDLNPKNSSSYTTFNNSTWSIEPQALYTITLGKGVLSSLVGATFQSTKTNSLAIDAFGFSNEALLENPGAADSSYVDSYSQTLYNYNALFGRLNYAWNNKYILNLTGRYDGSSRFGPGKQFHFFGAVGATWIFTEEAFIKNNLPFLSFGKLRGSFGTTGNDQIRDYLFYDLYSFGNAYQGNQGLVPTSLYNPDLHWELNKKLEAGIELGFLKDRISLEVNLYRNRSSDQLLPYDLSQVTGFGSITRNSPATIQNKGIEAVLRTVNIKTKDFTWSTSFNISANRNQLIAYPDLDKSSDKNGFVIGKSVSMYKLYKYAGVDPQTGVYTFYDSKGNITSTPNALTDMTELVDITPKYSGGLLNSLYYKGFSLDVNFSFISRMGQNAFGQQMVFPPGFRYNATVEALRRWQKPGDITDVRSYTQSPLQFYSQILARTSTRAVSKATYARLQNLSFGYQLPHQVLSRLRVANIRVYVQGQNLFTISSYKNTDPESLSSTRMPPLRYYTAGFQITL